MLDCSRPAGTFWLRLRLRLGTISKPGLLLGSIAYAYEVYWDGQRIGQLANRPASEIAQRAQEFGQEDDITVVVITREPRPRMKLSYSMVIGMATTKVTITLQNDQFDEIRALVAAGEAASVSGFVQHAVGVALHDAAGWRELLENAMEQTGGPLTNKERAWADAFLIGREHKKNSRKGKAA